MTWRAVAPAKINLTLGVRGRRMDGYHSLDSLVAFANIGDELVLEPADQFSLVIKGPFAGVFSEAERESGVQSTNIAVRAVYTLGEWAGCVPAGRLSLTKNLPLAAGLGGGSADAAATLRLLCSVWDVDPSDIPIELLTRLGADVPVCFFGQAAWLSGIGEVIEAAPPLPDVAIVLINPGVLCPTAEVFAQGVTMSAAMTPRPGQFVDFSALVDFLKANGNDLTEAASAIAPPIGDALKAMLVQPGCGIARMAGSGASVFGMFASQNDARQAAASIAHMHPNWWAMAGSLLSG